MRANNLKDEYYEYINDHPDAFIPKIYTTSSSKKSHVFKYEWKHIRNPMSFTVGEYTVVFSCHHFDETYTFIYKTDRHDIPEYKDMINILKYSIARRDQI